MKLTLDSIRNEKAAWQAAGFQLPEFDMAAVAANTAERPVWVHFGAGNIFRAFQAAAWQKMLTEGHADTGLVVVEGYDYEIIEKGYAPCDNLSILATLKGNGSVEKTVIGSISEGYMLDRANKEEFAKLEKIFANPSLQMASFTITEKGYAVKNAAGEILPHVAADLEKGPAASESYLGKLVSLLYARFNAGELPIALVSTDNCSHNGDKLKDAVLTYAKGWLDKGLVGADFVAYLQDASKVTYPWSMIDKITPRPDAKVEAILREDGVENLDPVITSKNTYIAPFVNAEEFELLVIEDAFPNGRPELEKAGIYFAERNVVDRVEKMKVCTCLNPLHTALAIYGCLLGYTLIADEMKDEQLHKLVERIGYVEGLPVVVDPGILRPIDFLDQVMKVRIPNPFMPDAPQRIATDTSQKLPIRFGETIKAYMADSSKNVEDLQMIPLVYAGWLRYLMAVDDEGNAFEPSSDPYLEQGKQAVAGFALGEVPSEEKLATLDALLSEASIFGVDLCAMGMDKKVKAYFTELIAGKGAVRATLKKYV